MPRILPRLLKKVADNSPRPCDPFKYARQPKTISIRKPVLPAPSFNPADYPQSILLSQNNPITSSRDYEQHKSLPPRIHVRKRVKSNQYRHDCPREMTEEERRWWSSPYLRMLATPIRRCFLSGQYLPSSFLIRLSAMRIPSSRPLRFIRPNLNVPAVLVPDGLQHTRFATKRSGTGVYMLCRKESLERTREKGAHKRYGAELHGLLKNQIRHLLRLRVLQELQLVCDQLRFRPKAFAHQTLVRRLTRVEWQQLQSTGTVSIKNAVALLVVPPVSRNPVTKERATPSMSSSPPSPDSEQGNDTARSLSSLYPVSSPSPSPSPSGSTIPEPLAAHQVPLYHGVSTFPEGTQRAALHKLLLQILAVERRARYGRNESQTKEKYSHAFVLLSDESNIRHGDIAAVAIALWRIRMFEGSGWDAQSGWLMRSKYRSILKFE
ncbi:hypothetical protein V5O48_000057 [Marasmius crinis-equi]|uniref:Uncharacterized protein n=1 Tax=Marasmius crinis-equi TaxID=585013 RepID=A0ABR3G2D4_9AGAR